MRCTSIAPTWSLWSLLLMAACASDEPSPSLQFSGERIDVRVLGDGFVVAARGRVPFEAFVLELRQRLRQMPAPAVQDLWVHVDVDADGGPAAARQVTRLQLQLQLMGIKWVDYL
ncbi:MAG TPA: hypothetical protein VK348_14505 [Planctomycetota bacterium]|nr:hypothetical protein [Planctomycetota bacterium]